MKDENLERDIHVVARSEAEEPCGRAQLDLVAEDLSHNVGIK